MASSPIAIAASDPALRGRIAGALEAGGLPAGPRAAHVSELASTDRRPVPDIVVIASPQLSPGDLRLVQEHLPRSRAIMVARAPSLAAVRAVVLRGAGAVVLDEDLERSLVPIVQAVHAGQLTVPRRLFASVAKPVLTAREKQVAGLVVMGFSNGEIAGRLFLAESTVKSHLSSLFAKLGVASRKEAASLILDREAGLGTGILSISDGAETSREANGQLTVNGRRP